MNYLNVKCKRCGYSLTVPERTESVVCGSCGYENKLKGVMSLLRSSSETDAIEYGEVSKPRVETKIEKSPSYKDYIPASQEETKVPSGIDEEPEGEIFPENALVSKILTLLFIVMPVIAMLADFFDLPSFILPLVIFVIVFVIFMRKKSK